MNRPLHGTTNGSSDGAWRTPHTRLDAALEQAALHYALGALTAAEAEAYAAHLDLCEVCSALVIEQRHVDATVAALLDGSAVAPSADAWNLIEERIERQIEQQIEQQIVRTEARRLGERLAAQRRANDDVQTWKTWDSVESSDIGAPGLSLVAMEHGGFEPTAIPGITTRRLSVDREARRVSMLVRMEPNTAYPAHRHGGSEECYVVSGDLRVGDVRMRAGDFQRAEAGSVHPIQATDGGCLLLITSSLDDELIEPR